MGVPLVKLPERGAILRYPVLGVEAVLALSSAHSLTPSLPIRPTQDELSREADGKEGSTIAADSFQLLP